MPDLEAGKENDSASGRVETDKLTAKEAKGTEKEDGDKKKGKDKEKEEEEKAPEHGGLKTIGKMYGNNLCCVWFLAVIVTMIHGCVLPAFGILFRELIDNIIYAENKQKASITTVYYFLAAGVIGLVSSIGQATFWGIYGTRIGARMRKDYFAKLLAQDLTYHDEKNSGKLNTKLISESFAVDTAIGVKTGFLVEQFTTFVFGFVFAFLYSWEMTLVLLATFPVTLIIGVIQGLAFYNMGGESADPFSDAGGFSYETLINVKTIVAFPSLVKARLSDYLDHLNKAKPLAIKRAYVIGAGGGMIMFGLFGVSYAIGLFYGMILVKQGDLKISNMFGAFFSYLMGGMALGQMGSATGDIQKGQMSANWFLDCWLRVPEIKGHDKSLKVALGGDPSNPMKHLKGKIELKNLSFHYKSAPEKMVLDDVSVVVEPGEQLAIVGPSGSGKSTIISLLERFYDPVIGEIRIDDELIHNYDLSFLRSQMALVSQLPLLFDTTIAENVRGGRKDLGMDDVIDACKRASAHEFIMKLPDKYDQIIGEMGSRLSGGQKQRISIARAIIGKPAILLLDEATSALDTKSEREVQAAIDKIALDKSQTIVTIAHRLSTIKNADKIMVLVEGEIDEFGDHSSLMANDGMYAALVQSQRLVDERTHAHEIEANSAEEEDDDAGEEEEDEENGDDDDSKENE